MTQENSASLRYSMEEANNFFDTAVDTAEERAGRVIRESVQHFLSVYGPTLPPELPLTREPDIHLITHACELVNTLAKRPHPLSDRAWYRLRGEVAGVLEQVQSRPI